MNEHKDCEKDYRELVDKLGVVLNLPTVKESGVISVEDIRKLVPELIESEDERIRKEILDYIIKGSESCYDVQQYGREKFEKWIAWLEKKCEQKSTDKVEPKFKIGDIIKPKCYNETHSIKAIGECYYILDVDIKIPFRDEDYWELVEQKLADKVEPKFKVGDVMRTLEEAEDGITDGLPIVLSVDERNYHCTNELIAIKDQDEYEYPPKNRKQESAE